MSVLFLMRHCEAESGERMDPTRALTSAGVEQARTMGKFLARQVGSVPRVMSSKFLRARQTLDVIAEEIPLGGYVSTPMLDPDAKARDVATGYLLAGNNEDVLVITHHPLTNELLELLTGGKSNEVAFGHGYIVKIRDARICWMVGPDLVAREDEHVIDAAYALADAALMRAMESRNEL